MRVNIGRGFEWVVKPTSSTTWMAALTFVYLVSARPKSRYQFMSW